jgi:hypothetical protein
MNATFRIFDRLSAPELMMFINLFGVDALPRLTNHTERIRQAMGLADEEQLKLAARDFRRVFDAAHPKSAPHRTEEWYPCQCCRVPFHPLKLEVTRGNGFFCGKAMCRKAARDSRKRKRAA